MIAPFSSPLYTGRTMNVHETFRRHPGRLPNVLYMFNLRLVSTGKSYGKIWDGFSLSTGKRFFLIKGFILKSTERAQILQKTVLEIFKIALRLQYRYVFMRQSVEILNVFNTLTLKQIFWKTKTFFKQLEYRFLVESTNIENASFSYKSVILETNVKTNRMVDAKWSYPK